METSGDPPTTAHQSLWSYCVPRVRYLTQTVSPGVEFYYIVVQGFADALLFARLECAVFISIPRYRYAVRRTIIFS
jgi:hypothetical protein